MWAFVRLAKSAAWMRLNDIGDSSRRFFPRRVVDCTMGEEFHSLNTTRYPWLTNHLWRRSSWVLFPEPSNPSTMKSFPGRSRSRIRFRSSRSQEFGGMIRDRSTHADEREQNSSEIRAAWRAPASNGGGADPGHDDAEHEGGGGQTVEHEGGEVAPAQVREQGPDDEETAHSGGNDPPHEGPGETRWDVLRTGQELQALVDTGSADDRKGEEEGELGGGFTGQAKSPGRRDGDAGAGHAGLKGGRLGQADGDGVGRSEMTELTCAAGPSVHQEQDHAERGKHDRDQPGIPQLLFDDVLEERADNSSRDRADHEEPGHSFIHSRHREASDRPGPGRQVLGDVPPEVRHGARERAHVQGDVERLVQGLVGEDAPMEEPGHQDQVPRARYRRELREALNDPQHDRLKDARPYLLSPVRLSPSRASACYPPRCSLASSQALRSCDFL